jgi:hypothetical protein
MSKVILCVDYQGPLSIQEYVFDSFNKDFLAKLIELEVYTGKIDRIKVIEVFDSLAEAGPLFTHELKFTHVDHTNVGAAVRKAQLVADRNKSK